MAFYWGERPFATATSPQRRLNKCVPKNNNLLEPAIMFALRRTFFKWNRSSRKRAFLLATFEKRTNGTSSKITIANSAAFGKSCETPDPYVIPVDITILEEFSALFAAVVWSKVQVKSNTSHKLGARHGLGLVLFVARLRRLKLKCYGDFLRSRTRTYVNRTCRRFYYSRKWDRDNM